jgi:hypothetical protein
MATTVINPQPSNNSSNGMGFLAAVIILVIFGLLFFVYGIPFARSLMGNGVQVTVPKSIDVNVKQSK